MPARLASFYFIYYGAVGVYNAYWSPYLVARGFSAYQIGLAYALVGLLRATLPLAWGWWADRRAGRMGAIRIATLLALLLIAAIPLVHGLLAILLLMLAYTALWNALLPQFEVVVLGHLHGAGGAYARVRLWGSIGFIVAILGIGPLLDRFGVGYEPWIAAVLFFALTACAWIVPDIGVAKPVAGPIIPAASFAEVLRRREVRGLILACLCWQLSFAPYYNFFTIYVEAHGYTRSFGGQLWSLGVAAEVCLFLIAGPLIRRFGLYKLMLVTLASAALRWLLIGLAVDNLMALLFAQILHATSFALFHAVAMAYIYQLFPAGLHGRAQALYGAVSYGLGGTLGSLVGSWLWAAVSPEFSFVAAAGAAAVGLGLAWRQLRPQPPTASLA